MLTLNSDKCTGDTDSLRDGVKAKLRVTSEVGAGAVLVVQARGMGYARAKVALKV